MIHAENAGLDLKQVLHSFFNLYILILVPSANNNSKGGE